MCCCSGGLKLGSLILECSAADWKIKNLSNAEKSAWAGCPTTLKGVQVDNNQFSTSIHRAKTLSFPWRTTLYYDVNLRTNFDNIV